MAAPQNHWKLGLFVVAGLAMGLTMVALLGANSMQHEVGHYVSYFDESVQGLEVGSPIKFRGVIIGTVGKIQVAIDHRHVEVESELGVEELSRLGLDVTKKPLLFGAPRRLVMTADLRLQLASAGLTGVKFLQLDFFDINVYPAPVLPFPVPKNYIPTAPSMMKNLEDSLTNMMRRLPEITDQVGSIVKAIDVIVAELSEQHIPQHMAITLETMDNLLATTERKLELVDTAGLSKHAKSSLVRASDTIARLDAIFERFNQDGGLLTTVERAGGSIDAILRDAGGLGGQLVDTLVSMQFAARSIKMLTEAVEQDPEMLLKGRSPERTR